MLQGAKLDVVITSRTKGASCDAGVRLAAVEPADRRADAALRRGSWRFDVSAGMRCAAPCRILLATLIVAAHLLPASAHAAPVGSVANDPAVEMTEHLDASFPDEIRQVVAVADGKAIIVPTSEPYLREVSAEGKVTVLRHPDVGVLYHIAIELERLWVVGDQGVLHRAEDGSWTLLPLPQRDLDKELLPSIAPLGGGEALVLRILAAGEERGRGTEVLRVNATAVLATEWFPDIRLGSAVTSEGSVWMIAQFLYPSRGGKVTLGYARYATGGWTLWLTQKSPGPLEGFDISPAAVEADLYDITSDRNGGAYATVRYSDRVLHVDATGATREAAPEAQFTYPAPAIGVDLGGALIVATKDDTHLSLLTVRSNRRERTNVSVPPWYARIPGHVRPVVIAASDGDLWIAARRVLLHRSQGIWVAYMAPAVADAARAKYRESRRRDPGFFERYGVPVVAVGLGFAVGSFGASEVKDSRLPVAGAEVLVGTAVAYVPWQVAYQNAPWTDPHAGEMARGWNMYMFGAGVQTAVLGSAVGAWGVGEIAHDSRHRGRAFLGACAGAAVGITVALTTTWIARDAPRPVRRVIKHLGPVTIGSGAAVGYQLAGGRPSPVEGARQ
jgi:hypothetical protein